MVVPDGEWEAVERASHAVIDEAKAAGAYVFGGGIDNAVPPVLVSADGVVALVQKRTGWKGTPDDLRRPLQVTLLGDTQTLAITYRAAHPDEHPAAGQEGH